MASPTSAPILPAHIDETVRAIAELHAQHLRQATPVQRIVDRSVKLVGRPQFVAILTGIVLVWICANIGLRRYAFDRPPFQTLQDIGELVGLYITILILITQRRENELTELREQLTLELAILCEQKNAKIIQLLEELRRDNPLIENREDAEAAALSVPADPQTVLEAIKESHSEMKASVEADVAAGHDTNERN
jgi:uncharacterized membrane protein